MADEHLSNACIYDEYYKKDNKIFGLEKVLELICC